jgi:hypothetical protein
MLQAIDIDLGNDISRFPRQLDEIVETLTDVEMVCFQVVKFSEEKTLSFFRAMADVDSARPFSSFLSSRSAEEQNFVIIFLTSGLRWRFFIHGARGTLCPLCSEHFCLWEHFLSCPMCPVGVSVLEFIAMVTLNVWDEIVDHVKRVVLLWLRHFDEAELQLKPVDILRIFSRSALT